MQCLLIIFIAISRKLRWQHMKKKPEKICNADSYITFRLVVEISKTRHLQRKVLCILNDEYVCGNAALLIYVCRRRFFYYDKSGNGKRYLQQGLEIRGFWFQKKTVQLKTALREVYTYVLNGIFFQKTV